MSKGAKPGKAMGSRRANSPSWPDLAWPRSYRGRIHVSSRTLVARTRSASKWGGVHIRTFELASLGHPQAQQRDVGTPRRPQNCSSNRPTLFHGNLAQRLFENFHRLSALNQIFIVHDDRRHRVDTLPAVELFALADLVGVEA
jgi:hypothetical protein